MWHLSSLALAQALGRQWAEAAGGVRRLGAATESARRPAPRAVALRPIVVR